MSRRLCILLITLSAAFTLSHADAKTLYTACAKCHGIHGEKSNFSRPIGGWQKERIVKALKEYRSGKRNLRGQGSIMRQRLNGFTDMQLEALADHIAALQP